MLDSPRIVSLSPPLVVYENRLWDRRAFKSQQRKALDRAIRYWRSVAGTPHRLAAARTGLNAFRAWRFACGREREAFREMIQQAQMEGNQ